MRIYLSFFVTRFHGKAIKLRIMSIEKTVYSGVITSRETLDAFNVIHFISLIGFSRISG